MTTVNTTAWNSWAEYRGQEQQTSALPSGGNLPVALFYPADYSVGMSNLGYHYIYRALKESGVWVERFFAGPYPFRSVEKDTLLERFETIMASISYEGDVPGFARWLADAGIAPSRTQRGERMPIVCAGGAITYINPLSLSDIADVVVLGDGLPVLPTLIGGLRSGRSRDSTLESLAEHPSIFVPSIHLAGGGARLQRSVDSSFDYGVGTWVSSKTVFGRTCLVELQRGCARKCRYCTLPACFGPFRQRRIADLRSDLERVAQTANFDQVGFVTPEASDYADLDALLEFVEQLGKGVSFASLRVDALTKRTVRALVFGGRRSLTIAPETGDDGLRAQTGKRFTNCDVIEKLQLAKQEGIRNVKLYFMMGLPNEEIEHIEAIANLCETIKTETGLLVHAAVSPFVPKPGTAWAACDFEDLRILKKKSGVLKKSFRSGTAGSLQIASLREALEEYTISWASAATSREIARRASAGDGSRLTDREADKAAALDEMVKLGLGDSERLASTLRR